MIEYNLNFEEALKYVIKENGWVQGEDYGKGVILRLGGFTKCVEVHCFEDDYSFPLQVNGNCYAQKYRVVHTQPEALKNKD